MGRLPLSFSKKGRGREGESGKGEGKRKEKKEKKRKGRRREGGRLGGRELNKINCDVREGGGERKKNIKIEKSKLNQAIMNRRVIVTFTLSSEVQTLVDDGEPFTN